MSFTRPRIYKKTYRWVGSEQTLLDAQAANGTGVELDVSQFRHICVSIATSGNANLTVKCKGSLKELDSINFGAIASPSNPWAYIGIYNYEDALITEGDTGVVYSGTDSVKIFEINTNGIRAITFEVAGYTSGTVTVVAYAVNNQ